MGGLANFSNALGRKTLSAITYWLDLVAFCQKAILSWFTTNKTSHRKNLNRANWQSFVTQTIFTGIYAIPIIILLSLIFAVGFTSQVIHFSSELSREIEIIESISLIICYELAPLMTALVLISRSGSAISVDIGNMKLRGEIDGLTLLAINVDDYIVAPRIFAGAISQLILAIYFAAIAVFGGILSAALIYSNTYIFSLDTALDAVTPSILLLFVIKNLVFGSLITGTACYQALQIQEQCTTQLPQQTQKAIVRALTQVFILDVLFMLVLI